MWQAGQCETYTDGPCHSPAFSSLRCVSIANGGWVLGCRVWRADPGRGLLLAAGRQSEGAEVRKSKTGNACGQNPDCHRSEAPLLSDTRVAREPLQFLSSRTGPCLPGTRKGCNQGQLSRVHGSHLSHVPHPHWGFCDPAVTISVPTPHQGGIMCSRAASGEDPCG